MIVPVQIERNHAESYTLRLLGEGKHYGDDYILSLVIDCTDAECEVKALDHNLTKAQRIELAGPIRGIAGAGLFLAKDTGDGWSIKT